MLLKLFKNNRAGGILFLLFLGLILWLPGLNRLEKIPQYQDMPFYNFLLGSLHLYPLLSQLLAFFLVALIAIMLYRLNVRFFLIQERSFMPASFYLLIVSAFPEMQHVSPILVGSFFLTIILFMLYSGYNLEKNSLHFFNLSLVFALGLMFYARLLWFVPFIWIVLLTIRQPGWRELVYPLLALLLLGLFLFTYNYVFAGESAQLALNFDYLRIDGSWEKLPLDRLVFLSYLFLLILLASMFILQRFQVRKIYVRNFYQSLFFSFIYTLAFFLFLSGHNYRCIFLLAIPVSYLLSNFFHTKRNRISSEIMLWLFVALIAWIHISHLRI